MLTLMLYDKMLLRLKPRSYISEYLAEFWVNTGYLLTDF